MKRSNEEVHPQGEPPLKRKMRPDSASVVADAVLPDPSSDSAVAEAVSHSGDVKTRVLIPGEAVGAVIGKGGSAARAILQKTGARVQVAQEVETPHLAPFRLLRLEGSMKAIFQTQMLLCQLVISQDPDPQKYHLMMLIPKDAAGIVIGKGGEVIKKMNAASGAHISVGAPMEFDRTVTIIGSHEAVARAHVLVCARVEEERAQHPGRYEVVEPVVRGPLGGMAMGRMGMPPMGAMPMGPMDGGMRGTGRRPAGAGATITFESMPQQEGQAAVSAAIPRALVGNVIGHGGSIIRDLHSTTGARLHLEDYVAGQSVRKLTISGATECVLQAQALVTQILRAAGASVTGGGPSPRTSAIVQNEGQTPGTLSVTNAGASAIIGHQGSVIRKIQSQTGARIHISDYVAGQPHREVNITGDPHAVDAATAAVHQCLSRMQDSQGGSLSGPDMEIELAPPQVGAVMGHGGENIRGIEQASGAKLRFSPYVPGTQHRLLTISGSQAAVATAQQHVDAILRNMGSSAPPSGFNGPHAIPSAPQQGFGMDRFTNVYFNQQQPWGNGASASAWPVAFR